MSTNVKIVVLLYLVMKSVVFASFDDGHASLTKRLGMFGSPNYVAKNAQSKKVKQKGFGQNHSQKHSPLSSSSCDEMQRNYSSMTESGSDFDINSSNKLVGSKSIVSAHELLQDKYESVGQGCGSNLDDFTCGIRAPVSNFARKDSIYDSFTNNFNAYESADKAQLYEKTTKNAYSAVAPCFKLEVKDVKVGFLEIPSKEAILDVIRKGSVEIYHKIQKVFKDAKKQIFAVLNGAFCDIKPQVKAIIAAGNKMLYKDITIAFRDATNRFNEYLNHISKMEKKGTSKNLCKMCRCMQHKIRKVLEKMNKQIIEVAKHANDCNIDAVITALTEANEDVLTQIETLLDDPNNTSAIIPQLILADPVLISNLLNCENNKIHRAIIKIMAKALHKIKKIIDYCSAVAVVEENVTLDISNDAIIAALNKEVNKAMRKIQCSIDRITKEEVKAIERLEKKVPPHLPGKIQKITIEMMHKICRIIQKVTDEEIKETNEKIDAKNDYIINRVRGVLC